MIDFGKLQVLLLQVILGELLTRIDDSIRDLHNASRLQNRQRKLPQRAETKRVSLEMTSMKNEHFNNKL